MWRIRRAKEPKRRFPVLALIASSLIFIAAGFVAKVAVGFDGVPELPAPRTTLPLPASAPLTTTTAPHPPLSLKFISADPESGAVDVAPDSSLEIRFSVPLSNTSPLPTLSPLVSGAWRQLRPGVLTFLPSVSFVPYTTEVVTVPGGPEGILGAQGQTLGTGRKISFKIAAGSIARLQQLLAQLGYLPLNFVPQSSSGAPPGQMAMAQPGSFAWRWTTLPASLTSMWTPGVMDILTKGAIMRFEDQMGLPTDGVAGPSVWSGLLGAADAGTVDPAPYDYVVVSTALPQKVTVYENGADVMETLANTGVAAAPTVKGTFPVYLRYRSTTMAGINPDGTHYNDPGVPWVSYFNGGQGLHGFVRPGYGYPQSVGCVEMPVDAAAEVWPLTPIGTLVTVL